MDHLKEYQKALALRKAVQVVIKGVQKLHPEYEPLLVTSVWLVNGVVPNIKTACEKTEDGSCIVTPTFPINGLTFILEQLDEDIEKLKMEVELDGKEEGTSI